MSVRDDLLAANERWVSSFAHGDLDPRPAKRLAVVTCMDARLEPLEFLGLELGDAHVVRNAGARVTDDVLRSLAVGATLLGVREAIVIGHTECGLASTTNDELRELVGEAAAAVDFLAFDDLARAVAEDVERIRESPLLPRDYAARGYVYDVRSGRLSRV